MDDDTVAQRSVVRAVAIGLVLLVTATMIARLWFGWVNRTSPPPMRWVTSMDLDRVRDIAAVMPTLAAKDEPSAFMVGPSTAFYGFHPDVFDAAMAEHGIQTVSYNLGVIGNITETDGLIVRRMGDAFRAQGRAPKVVMLTFGPMSMSKGFLEGRTRPHERKKAMLMTPAEIAQLFFDDPHASTELAVLRFYGGMGAADSNSLIARRVFYRVPGFWPIREAKRQGEWEQISNKVNAGYADQLGRFDVATRGVFNPLAGNDVADYDRMAELAFSDSAMEKQAAYWGTDDLDNIEIEPSRIEWLVQAIQESQSIAEHTVLVVPPMSEFVQLTERGRLNVATALSEIASRTGVPIIDIGDRPEFVRADFVDFTHLKYNTGAPKFTRMVAEGTAAVIRGEAR